MIQGTLNVNFFFKHHIPNKSNIFLSFKVNCRPSAVGTLSSFPLCLTSVSRSASSEYTLVLREVRATLMSVSRSISRVTFNSSRTANAFSLADSKPSAMILGWRPCKTKSKGENISEFSGGGEGNLYATRASLSHLWHIEVSLLQQFTNDEDIWRGSVSSYVVLRRGNLCNERRRRVLNLLRGAK